MNFTGKFGPDLAGSHFGGYVNVDSTPSHSSGGGDTITIPDAHLLFTGDYKRSGVDLILSKDGHELVVQDYFRGEKRASLASPDGAHLTGDIVNALAGHVEYAQAAGDPDVGKVIGHVTKLTGSASVIRNGVSIVLNMGDNVHKGDVVQSGSGSSLGITFVDGTVFGLSSNARMVLNEMVYDPNGTSNSSLLSLVQGTITFVAGETAKHGDMKVDTPTATLGIRGTAVLVEIDFQIPGQGDAPPVKFQVLAEPDGHTGSYVLYNKPTDGTTPVQIGVVNQSGLTYSVSASQGFSSQAAPPLPPEAAAIIQQVFTEKFQNYTPPPAPDKTDNPNNPTPQQSPGGGSSTPPNPATPLDTSPINNHTPVGQPSTPIPINLTVPAPTSDNPAATTTITVPVSITVLKAIDVAPVANKPSFVIADQVKISDSNPSDISVPYVPGTAAIVSVVSTSNIPAGIDVTKLIAVDPQTGAVSYDPASFAFLKAGSSAVITIGFDSSAGSDTFHETLTLTIDGVGTVAPTVAIATAEAVTNLATQTISGTVIAGEAAIGTTVTLFDNGAAIGTASVGSGGTWSASVTLSGDGTHSIVAQDTDAAGNLGTSSPVIFTLDTAAPTGGTPHLVAASGNITNGTAPSFTVVLNPTVAAGDTVQLLLGGSPLAHPMTHTITAAEVAAGSVSLTVVAGDFGADGAKSVTAQFSDGAGNTSTSSALSFTLDTTPPVVAIASTGGATNQAVQTISGTVDVAGIGSTVTLFDNGASIGTAIVGSGGSWSTSVTLSGNGSHSIVAKDTDAAGNTGSSTTVVYTLSTTAPAVSEALTTDTGSSSSDRITSNDSLSGTGLANTAVHFTIDGSAIATTVTADGQGAWSFTPTGLADGSHTIVASQTDSFGNAGTASLSFILDTTAPVVAITSTGGVTNQAVQTISGTLDTADIGSTVTLFENGSTTALGTATVGSGGVWSTSVTLSGNGSHSIVAKDTDAAGNTGSSTPVVYTLSTTAPTISDDLTIDTGSSASDRITSNDALSGTGLANTAVHFTIDGSAIATTVTADGQGAWSFTPTGLADGSHTIVASQTDSFGNIGTASLSFTLDTTAPVVAITSTGGAINQAALNISGTVDTADIGSTVTLFENGSTTALGTATVGSGGVWSTSVTLSGNGSHSIVAKDTDAAGNTGSSTPVVYTLSTTAPTVSESLTIDTGSSVSDRITSNDVLSGTGLANTAVHFMIDGSAIATTVTADAQGSWSFTPSGLADGAHTIVASQTDSFGNIGTASLSFTLDTTAPVVAITSTGGATNHAVQTISGTVDVADIGSTVTLFDNGASIGTAIVGSGGVWSTSVTLSGNGSHSIVAKDTDAAGNSGSSTPVVYTLSTTAPTISENLTTDTGSSASDRITSNDALSGTGLANTAVHFTIDGSATAATVTADAQGAWSFTPSGLADGTHTIVASQTDSFGNTGTASLSFTLDTTAPVVAITSTGGATNQAAQSISGTVDAADIGSTVTLFDNGTLIGTAVVGSGGVWSTSVTLSGNGSHSIIAKDTDAAGNTGSSTPVVYTLSTTAPTVSENLTTDTGSSASDRITSNDALSGTGLANTAVHFTIDGSAIASTVTADAQGAWSFTPLGLADGSHTIVASQTDNFGNTGTASLSFTLDTTAPVVAITSTGGATNQATQTISGTLDAADIGTVVTLFDNGSTTALGTAVVGSGGVWSTSVTLSGNGSHSIIARDTDTAGNTGSSTPVVYTLSTTAPAVSEALTTDTGSSSSDGITSNDALSGTGLANTAVHFTIDGSAISSTVTANALGAWSFTPSGLADGTHTIVASQTDSFGNTGTASLSFTLDTTAPVVVITSTGGVTNQVVQTVSGTVDAADIGSTVTLFDNGGSTALGTAVVGSGGSWSTSVTLSGNGSHSIIAKDTDAAGNTGSSTPVVYTLDTIAPTGGTPDLVAASDSGSSSTDNVTNVTAPSFTVAFNPTVAAGDTVQLLLAGTVLAHPVTHTVTAAEVAAGSVSLAVVAGDLGADGSKSVTAQFSDAAGNTSTSSALSFTLDTTAPVVAITSAGGTTNQAIQTISGTVDTADIGTVVTLFDNGASIGTANVGSGGSWSASVTLSGNGSQSIVAKDTDTAGNTGSSTPIVYTLSTTAPTISENLTTDTGSSASDRITSNDALSGTGLANTAVHFTIDGSAIATTVTADAQGAWSFTPSGLADGSHIIVASQTDNFGNTGTASLSFTLDTTAPVVAITSTGGATNQAAQSISGTVDAADIGSTVTLFDNGSTTALGTGNVGSGGIWSTSVTLSGNGSHSIIAKDTDTAGNTGSSTSVVYTLDTIAPTGGTPDLVAASDSGSSSSDNITNVTAPSFTVALNPTVAAGDTVQLLLGGSTLAHPVTHTITAAEVAAGGVSLTVTAGDLGADGSKSVMARFSDAAGNISTTSALSFTLDTTAPVVSISSTGGATTQATQTISGTVDIADIGSTVTLFDNGSATALGTAIVGSGGVWSTSVTLSGNGSHSIVAKDTDAAGNIGNSTPVAYTLNIVPNSWADPSGGSWAVGANWSSGTVPVNTANVIISPIGTAPYAITILPGTTVSANSLTLNDPDVTLLDEATFTIAASLLMTAGAIEIENGGTLSLGGSSSFTTGFAGTGGNLILGNSPGFTGTVNAISTATGAVNITGSGSVTTTSGDAIDLTASGGTPASPSNLTIGLSGGITGAANGIDVVQNGSGNIAIATTRPVAGLAGRGIIAEENTTGIGSILINGSGSVSGNGAIYSGIVAENLNTANGNNITISQTGNVSGGYDGIRAFTDGTGNVTVNTSPGTNITGTNLYGIEAFSNSTGSISVTTSANGIITSGSAGINVYNQATSIPQTAGATTSTISVTAAGTIDSGFLPTGSSSRPAGILAGYKGGATTTPDAAVFGNVIVNNSANINAAGGDGIRAYNYGSGNVAVQDLTGTTIVANDEFGISAATYGIGNVSVSSAAGDIIDSGSSGIQAINLASAIAAGAGSSVTLTARGTINSGTHLTPGGVQPQGLSAGYYPGNVGAPNNNVNGTVNVDNFANVTAAAGYGIDAYNYGNGSVTLTDEAGTAVSGAQYGIAGYSLSFGSGSVTINVGSGATISAGALYGLAGIAASENNAGNISITTSTGDVINSGGTGIQAGNQATSASATSQISIIAAGTINSGFDMSPGGGAPGGIWAGYTPGGVGTVNTNVAGNVFVDTSAIINAAAGVGIGLYNWGIGNLTATVESPASITAAATGVNAYAQGGGNVSITNKGTITVASGVGISAGTGTGIANSASGVVSISNSGAITSLGSGFSPAVQINNGSTQAATFTNSGTVTANLFSASGSNLAIAGYNGSFVINNSGRISGNASLATGTFNNNAGGVWNVNGFNSFGSGANAINNAGTINIAGVSFFSTGGTLAFNNSNAVNVLANGAAYIGGAVSGVGTFSIGDRSELEFASSVAAGQTVSFFDSNGLLTLDSQSTFGGTIAGLAIGDAIDFMGIAVQSASIAGTTLTVTETNGSKLFYQVSGAPAGTAFNVLSGNEIVLVPASAITLTGPSGPLSFAPATTQFYILSNATISGTGGNGLNIASSDSTSGDYLTVDINQSSSISLSGAFNAVNLTTSGANIALVNAGTISSPGGIGILVNSGSGSADIIDYGNVSGNQFGIDVHTSGLGTLNIVVGGTAVINATTSYGILAIATAGALDVSTLPGVTINSGSVGILAQNQGSSVPLANNSSISVSAAGTINSGSNPTGSGSEPAGILAGYLGGTSSPSSIPNPPLSTVFGNVNVHNAANINAAAGIGISAFNYGVGDITVSDGSGTTITATAAGTTASGFTQYGISAFNYGSGKTTVTTDSGSTIKSGGAGINATNQATAILASAASNVTVVALGAINSGANLNNAGGAPAGILAGFNPSNASLFNANVAGNVLVNDSGSIVAGAGDGIDAYNYGIGNVEVDLGFGASVTALTASTAAGRKAPYGIGAFNYGPGDVAVATSSGSVIQAGSVGIDVSNQATSISLGADSVITVSASGSISSGTILNPSGSQPAAIQAGYLGGTGGGTANTSVNGTVIVNNDANISAAGGWGIDAYNYGNGNVTVNDSSGTTISGAQYGIAAYAESGGTGNVAVNVSSNATIIGTAINGILAFSTDAGNIFVTTATGDLITSGSAGINAVNEATVIPAAANSSIVVTAYGTINSGTALTGTGSPPGGITAGYLGGTTIPTVFPLTGLNGDVVVNNFATINAAGGDGIRAYNYGIGDITVNDEAGSITLGGADLVNGYDVGISAVNEGTGNVDVSIAAGTLIDSRNGSSGIAAVNKAPAPSPGSAVSIPATSHISVLAYGTIESGTGPTGSGDPPAGILAGYNPNSTDAPNDNVHGNVWVDDYASIVAPAGTDGIRGVNYGTGTISVLAEAGAVITAGRYGIAAFGDDGGDVTVTNYATLTGGIAAINATTTSTGTVVIDNYGNMTGAVLTANAVFDNELGAVWNLAGSSTFATGTNTFINAGTIDTTGTSSIASGGSLSVTNTGTVNVQSGSLDIAADVTGTGVFTVGDGATLEFGGKVAAGETVTFLGSSGTLILDHSETSPFSGTIANLDATAISHDSIDLLDMVPGLSASALYVPSVANPTTGTLIVSDGSGHSETFNLVNYTGAGSFTAQSDGHGGTLVFDPPAPAAATDVEATEIISTDAQLSSSGIDGSVTFAINSGAIPSASATPDHGGLGYIGNFSLDPVTNSNGVESVGWHFALDQAHASQIMPSQVLAQSYVLTLSNGQPAGSITQEITVMTGGAGNDTFNFKPGMGSAIVTNFSEQADDRIDLHQTGIASFAQLQPMLQAVHNGHDTLVDLGHGDTLTIANVSPAQLHATSFILV